jgi:hypothetical protein
LESVGTGLAERWWADTEQARLPSKLKMVRRDQGQADTTAS